jgi:hypothetical protein
MPTARPRKPTPPTPSPFVSRIRPSRPTGAANTTAAANSTKSTIPSAIGE